MAPSKKDELETRIEKVRRELEDQISQIDPSEQLRVHHYVMAKFAERLEKAESEKELFLQLNIIYEHLEKAEEIWPNVELRLAADIIGPFAGSMAITQLYLKILQEKKPAAKRGKLQKMIKKIMEKMQEIVKTFPPPGAMGRAGWL